MNLYTPEQEELRKKLYTSMSERINKIVLQDSRCLVNFDTTYISESGDSLYNRASIIIQGTCDSLYGAIPVLDFYGRVIGPSRREISFDLSEVQDWE